MAKKVLTIDDSSSIRQMVFYTLNNAGYQVDEATNGQEGLNKAKQNRYDLVLTDQNMPVMDGLTVIRNLRVLAEYKNVPILMLTTEAGEAMKSHGKAAGATGWLVKPFNPNKLLEVVKSVLNR
jgi:two-component system chemotaxis response regulator CheY